jgi:hypothetical protein
MLTLVRSLSLLALAAFLAVNQLTPDVRAQQPDGLPRSGSGLSFRPYPSAPPLYATNPYAPSVNYNGPYGGYMSGTSDVINAQGSFAVQQQEAVMERERIKQARIETRRKALDEDLYERAVKPTAEDDAERARLQAFQWARNDPPLTTIWSGGALNDLLMAIQRQQAQGIAGPTVPLAPDVLSQINVTGGQTGGSLALLKNGGRLRWPFALDGSTFAAERQALDKVALTAYQQAGSGNVDPATLQQMTTAVNNLQNTLTNNVANMGPNEYIAALRFVNELNATLTVLQSPDVANYVKGPWQAKGETVGQLVQYMTSQGLRFAPALPAGEADYVALQRAMAAYYPGPNPKKPWDPLAK